MRSKTLQVLVNVGQVLALCSAAVVVSPSYAEKHIHAGSACVPQYTNYNYKREYHGTVRNTSNADQVWECPLMRRTSNPLKRVYIRATNFGAGNNNVLCVLRSKWHNGAAYQTIQRTAAKGSGYMDFYNGIQVKPNGAVSLRCKLPAKNGSQKSAIVNYVMEE